MLKLVSIDSPGLTGRKLMEGYHNDDSNLEIGWKRRIINKISGILRIASMSLVHEVLAQAISSR